MKSIELAICVGSCCHLNNSRGVIEAFKKDLKHLHLEEKVILKASFCLGDCQKGGVEIQVGNKRIHGVKPEDCEKILTEEILPQLD